MNNQSLLAQLYPGKIVIPQEVYNELSNPAIAHLKTRVDQLIADHIASVENIEITTDEYALYRELTTYSKSNVKVIGKGEAASIVLTKKYDGILGSNNLRDIRFYIEKFSLRHITTGDILIEAFEKEIITEQQANEIWSNMLAKRRKIGANSFTEFLQTRKSVLTVEKNDKISKGK